MTNGIFLGGFAQGQQSADQQATRDAALGLRQQQFDRTQQNDLEAQRQKAIANTAQIALDTAEAARGAGKTVPTEFVENFRQELLSLGASQSIVDGLVQRMQIPPQVAPSPEEKIAEEERLKLFREQEAARLRGETGETASDAGLPPIVSTGDLSKTMQQAQVKSSEKLQLKSQLLNEVQMFGDLVRGANTGALTSATLPFAQFFREAGIGFRDDVPRLEAIQAGQNQLALRLRNPDSGFGLTGSTSDRDVKFLKDAVGGLQNTPEGNRAAVIVQLAKMRRDLMLEGLRFDLISRNALGEFKERKNALVEATPLFTPDEEAFLASLKESRSRTGGTSAASDEEILRGLGL